MVLSTLLASNKDDVVITAASPMTSFDWSDFPLVHQFNPDDDTVDFGTSDVCDSSACSFDFQHTNKKTKLTDTTIVNTGLYTSYTPFLSSSDSSLTSTSSTVSASSRDCRVSFAPRVEVREYDLTIGDNLSCDQLPLSLGWNHLETTYKGYSCPSTRRHGNQLKLSFEERRNLLSKVYSQDELSRKMNTIHHVGTMKTFSMENNA